MTSTRKGHIVMLTRDNCEMCETTERTLRRYARAFGISVDLVDVATDPALVDTYGERVPVLLGIGSKVLAEGQISNFAIQRALLKVRLARGG